MSACWRKLCNLTTPGGGRSYLNLCVVSALGDDYCEHHLLWDLETAATIRELPLFIAILNQKKNTKKENVGLHITFML